VYDDIYGREPGALIATGISEAEYLDKYAEHFCEWLNGNVIRIAPETFRHGETIGYLMFLLEAYFALKPIGQLIGWRFPTRLSSLRVCREPNLMVILNPRRAAPEDYMLDGAADICIEVVSESSVARDRGEKFVEYEQGGVREYWIFDYRRKEAILYRRNEEGVFARQSEDEEGNYRTPLLPGLVINVPTLWREKLPGLMSIAKTIEAMLNA
jgi:Uma2 family endonuclease